MRDLGEGGVTARPAIATIVGVVGFGAYVAVAVALGDHVVRAHWAIQAAYYLVAGSLWVLPVRWLMYWGAGLR